MQEFIEQLLGYLRGMWHRRWIGLAFAWLVAIIGTIVVFRLPDRYEASARVYVDTQSLLRPLLAGMAVAPDANQQVQLLTRTLLSRPNVEKIIRKADLDTSKGAKAEDLVDDVTKYLQIGRAPGGDNLYLISYRSDDRKKARDVVQSALSTFIEQSLGEHRSDSDNARKFLDQQIKEVEARLGEAEARQQAFRLKYMGLLGTSDKTYLGQIAEVNEQIKQTRLDLRVSEQTRDGIRQQLEQQTAAGAAASPTSIRIAVPELDGRIDALKVQVDELLRKFTEQHPDVVAAKRLIAQLEEQRKSIIEARQKAAANNPDPTLAGDPIAQQLKVALNEAEANITTLRARLAEYEARQGQLKAAAEAGPRIDTEQAQLNRDYSMLRSTYQNLLTRRETAIMSGKLEEAGVAELRIIDPPRVSPNPVAPNRLMLLAAVVGGSLAAGLAVSFLVSQVWPTFHDGRALRGLGRPILGMVSSVPSPFILKRRRRAAALFVGGMAGLLITYGALFAFTLVTASRAV